MELIGPYVVGFGVRVEAHRTRENNSDVFTLTIYSADEHVTLPSQAAPGTQLAIQEAYGNIMRRFGDSEVQD